MSLVRNDLPYSKKRLEDLAAAMGIDSAYLWVDPANNSLRVNELAEEKLNTPAETPGEEDEDESV